MKIFEGLPKMEASVEHPQECGFFYSFKFKMESLFKEFVGVAR